MSFRRYIQIPKGPILVNYGTMIKTIPTNQWPLVCRACLSDTNLRPLSNTVAATFSDLLKTKYVFGDTNPQFLCIICLGLLKKFHHFQDQCDRSQKIMARLNRAKKLTQETIKAERESSRFALNLSAIENTDFRPTVKLIYTKTLCIDVARTHKRSPNCDPVPVPRKKKKKVKVKQKPERSLLKKYNIINEASGKTSQSLELMGTEDSLDEMPPTKTLCIDVARTHKRNPYSNPVPVLRKKKNKVKQKPGRISLLKKYNIINEASGKTSQSLELMGAEDSLDEMPPTYNGIPLYTDGEIERIRQEKQDKLMGVKKRNQVDTKKQNLVDKDDSDTLTASSCDEYRQVLDEAEMNKQIKKDTLRHVESDHLYAKPPIFKSERLNQRMKANKVYQNDQYIYSDFRKKQWKKTKLSLGLEKKHNLPHNKCIEQNVIVEIPEETVELVTESDDETKPDVDSILLRYLENQENANKLSEDIKMDDSYEDIKPKVEDIFVK